MTLPSDYPILLSAIKERLAHSRARALQSVNSELIITYWEIGRLLHERQKIEGWGAGVIPRLVTDLKNDMPEVKGFSERNIQFMIKFHGSYQIPEIPKQLVSQLPIKAKLALPHAVSSDSAIPKQAVSELATDPVSNALILALQIPWGHNILLIQRVADLETRQWYMSQIIAEGWSRSTLTQMIESQAHERQGAAVTNFDAQLSAERSKLATQTIKDPYIFDFLTLDQPFRERELELGLLKHLKDFLIELGRGFAFVGSQYHLTAGDDDFYLDLLFYHLELRCYLVIDLKIGPFKPEYAGKMNFYCNLVDDQQRHEQDHPTIGLILCQEKNQVVAEYALRGMEKPIGVSEYQLTRALPKELKSSLPSIEQIEKELEDESHQFRSDNP